MRQSILYGFPATALRRTVLLSGRKRKNLVGPVGNVGKSRRFLRDFSKRRWESALFADFHGRGIFHQALSQSSITHKFR